MDKYPHICRFAGKQYAERMRFNNLNVLTIVRDYTESGQQVWHLLAGTECASGFKYTERKRRRDCEIDAVQILRAFNPKTETLPIIAREHGHRKYQWMNNRVNVITHNEPPTWRT